MLNEIRPEGGTANIIDRQRALQMTLDYLVALKIYNGRVSRFLAPNHEVPIYLKSFKHKDSEKVPIVAVPNPSLIVNPEANALTASIVDAEIVNMETLKHNAKFNSQNLPVFEERQEVSPEVTPMTEPATGHKNAPISASTIEPKTSGGSTVEPKAVPVTQSSVETKPVSGTLSTVDPRIVQLNEDNKFAASAVSGVDNSKSVIERATEIQKLAGNLRETMGFTVRISDIKIQNKKFVIACA